MKLIYIILSLCLLTSCFKENEKSPLQGKESSHSPATSSPLNKRDFFKPEKTFEEHEEEIREKQKRKGEMDLEHIENVNVEGRLLQTVLALFDALKAKDEQGMNSLIYDSSFDIFTGMEPYILAITKIELDRSRVDAVRDEYSLGEISDEVAIVKISLKTLNRYLEETIGVGDYIFIRVDEQWKFYRFQ